MTTETQGAGGELPIYRVRARNTSADSENKIHDDRVAAQFGFKGGLVPGTTIYAYMTVPLVARFCYDWLERGSMQVKFHKPIYEGEEVLVRAEVDRSLDPVKIVVTAERGDETVCASGIATINDRSAWLGEPSVEDFPERQMPEPGARPEATPDNLIPGSVLGTLIETIDTKLAESILLPQIDEKLAIYSGPGAVAHPAMLLGLANQIMMRNFRLGPWIHAASDLINWSLARDGEQVSVRGKVLDHFERKGREFVVLGLLLLANRERVVQQVRHTAIFRIQG